MHFLFEKYKSGSAFRQNVDLGIFNELNNHSTQAKSLKLYNALYKQELGIRISANNFDINNNIKKIPLYVVFCLKNNI